jgi:hypothetical protein
MSRFRVAVAAGRERYYTTTVVADNFVMVHDRQSYIFRTNGEVVAVFPAKYTVIQKLAEDYENE